MALCDFHWFSNTLGKQVGVNVIIPEKAKPPFATFYLLHGLSDDYTMWNRRTRIELHAANLPLIVVMPDGFRGWYTNNEQGPAYATYIGQELVEMIDRVFPTKKNRADRAIGGLSMGGYGAMSIGLNFPDTFCSIVSHSGALMRGTQEHKNTDGKNGEIIRIMGEKPKGTHHDLIQLAKQCRDAKKLPKIRIDCGVDDFLLNENRDLHAALEKLKVPHEYEEFPGAHTWDYWELHVQDALKFHAKNMKLKPIS